MYSFRAKIEIIGVNPYVSLPEKVLEAIFLDAKKSRGPIQVKGKLNGEPFLQTLVKFQRLWRLYLNTPMRQVTKTTVGDIVDVKLMYDPALREIPFPEKLCQKLEAKPEAKATFESLPPYRQKEILRYLGFLKNEDSLNRNIEKIMDYLNGKKVDHVLLRDRKSLFR